MKIIKYIPRTTTKSKSAWIHLEERSMQWTEFERNWGKLSKQRRQKFKVKNCRNNKQPDNRRIAVRPYQHIKYK